MMKNILVTGAAGFIGIKMVSFLLEEDTKIYALIEKGDTASRKKLLNLSSSIEIVESWEQMRNDAEKYPSFDKIFHLATVGVRPDFDDIDLFCDVNIKMGCQLVDFAAANKSCLIINFGSCFEYGDHGDILLTEDMDCRPESLYAISKNASVNLMTAYAKRKKVPLITVRPFGVFGEGEGINRLAPSVIRSCLKGEMIKTTAGEQIRDFVNVKDVAKSIINLSEAEYVPYEIYNICSDNPVSVRNFICEIVETCDFDINMVSFGSIPYRQNEAMMFAGDNSKLQNCIHYSFPKNHREGILDIYNTLKTEE